MGAENDRMGARANIFIETASHILPNPRLDFEFKMPLNSRKPLVYRGFLLDAFVSKVSS